MSSGASYQNEDGPLYNNDEVDLSGPADVSPEIISELRESLGGIPEIVTIHGYPSESPMIEDYDPPPVELGEARVEHEPEEDSLGGTEEEAAAIFGAPAEQEGEQSEDVGEYAVPVLGQSLGEDEDEEDNYVDSLDFDEDESESGAAAAFEKARRELDLRLAKMAQFLPEKVRVKLDEKFTEAVKLAGDKTDEAYGRATEGFAKIGGVLDTYAPQLRSAECAALREKIQKTLDRDGDVLPPADLGWFKDEFSKLNTDTPTEEEAAKKHLDDLRQLSANLDGAIEARLKAIMDLNTDYERMTPILERALKLEHAKHDELEKAVGELNKGFAGQFAKEGLSVEEIAKRLTDAEGIVNDIFSDSTVEDALKQQKASLPASVESLEPSGPALGKGAFGEVFSLDSDTGASLVGKSFSSGNAEAKKEMEHEAEVYARIGEHPNIAKCYGIQEVGEDAQPMLVMDKIEGPNIEKAFEDLDKRYRKGELSRVDYMAGVQHLMKGTLTGLAHMESMGLVHKDIKGDNIKFDKRTNQPILIDMGLAQDEGKNQGKSFFFIEPPENRAKKDKDRDDIVTTVWDSFTVGKMLFEETERDSSGDAHMIVPGEEPVPVKDRLLHREKFTGRVNADKTAYVVEPGARKILDRDSTGEYEAKLDEHGQVIGRALKKGETAEQAAQPGYYGAETAYVDFMNRLTHPDPNQRMSPSEALKHPFMQQGLNEGRDMDAIFGPKLTPAPAPAAPEGEVDETYLESLMKSEYSPAPAELEGGSQQAGPAQPAVYEDPSDTYNNFIPTEGSQEQPAPQGPHDPTYVDSLYDDEDEDQGGQQQPPPQQPAAEPQYVDSLEDEYNNELPSEGGEQQPQQASKWVSATPSGARTSGAQAQQEPQQDPEAGYNNDIPLEGGEEQPQESKWVSAKPSGGRGKG